MSKVRMLFILSILFLPYVSRTDISIYNNFHFYLYPLFFHILVTVSITTQTKRLQLTTFYLMLANVFCAHQSAYLGDDLKRLIILNLKQKQSEKF
ncbi:MAG: hypothetical protein ACJAT1_001830 [Marivirga sp.]|jgi:hypothetical protein